MKAEHKQILMALALLLIFGLAGCASKTPPPPSGGAGTPSPTSSPSSPGTPSPTGSPTGSPSSPGIPSPTSGPSSPGGPGNPSPGQTGDSRSDGGGSATGDGKVSMPSSDIPDPLGGPAGDAQRKEAGDRLKKAGRRVSRVSDELMDPSLNKHKPSAGSGGQEVSDEMAEALDALHTALADAGVILEQAGESIGNAASPEEIMAAAEAIARARVVVVEAAETLETAMESGDLENDPLMEEAQGALNEANIAIVLGGGALDVADLGTPPPGGAVNDLEQELEESLRVFDTEIQEARNRVLTPPAETPQRPPETVADDTSAGGLGEAQPDSQLAKGSNVVAPEQQGSADSQDDDIVARQLREAAVAETDPELKAKLWEEYHRYKAGAGN